MFEWLVEKIREMERERASRVKRITCHGHNLPLNVTLENGYWNSFHHGAGSWADSGDSEAGKLAQLRGVDSPTPGNAPDKEVPGVCPLSCFWKCLIDQGPPLHPR
jgi:hypothetical protein